MTLCYNKYRVILKLFTALRKTKLITISISPELFKKVDELAKEEDRTRSGIFREAFKSYLAEREREKTRKKALPPTITS